MRMRRLWSNHLLLLNTITAATTPIYSPTIPPLPPPSLGFPASSNRRRRLSISAAAHTPIPTAGNGIVDVGSKKVLLKGLRYDDFEKWVQSQGFRPGQALMLWKRLYGNDIWAHSIDELEGFEQGFHENVE